MSSVRRSAVEARRVRWWGAHATQAQLKGGASPVRMEREVMHPVHVVIHQGFPCADGKGGRHTGQMPGRPGKAGKGRRASATAANGLPCRSMPQPEQGRQDRAGELAPSEVPKGDPCQNAGGKPRTAENRTATASPSVQTGLGGRTKRKGRRPQWPTPCTEETDSLREVVEKASEAGGEPVSSPARWLSVVTASC